jgi:hypothetical protein
MYTSISDELAKNPWYKIVEFLQQNWAVIVEQESSVLVVFFGDTCGVFDEMTFDSLLVAETALKRNGFKKFMEDTGVHDLIGLPRGEFQESPHPNGRIYSSGRYWS